MSFETQIIKSNSGGNVQVPIYKGALSQKALSEVWVDGSILEFSDESVAAALKQAILTMWPFPLSRRWRTFDCNDFVSMMLGQETGRDNPFESTSDRVESADRSVTNPVVLSVKFRDMDPIPVHTLYPAHTLTNAMYLHKLGDTGPLCFSSLETAKEILRAPVVAIGIARNTI